jgi:hypothetical protein
VIVEKLLKVNLAVHVIRETPTNWFKDKTLAQIKTAVKADLTNNVNPLFKQICVEVVLDEDNTNIIDQNTQGWPAGIDGSDGLNSAEMKLIIGAFDVNNALDIYYASKQQVAPVLLGLSADKPSATTVNTKAFSFIFDRMLSFQNTAMKRNTAHELLHQLGIVKRGNPEGYEDPQNRLIAVHDIYWVETAQKGKNHQHFNLITHVHAADHPATAVATIGGRVGRGNVARDNEAEVVRARISDDVD